MYMYHLNYIGTDKCEFVRISILKIFNATVLIHVKGTKTVESSSACLYTVIIGTLFATIYVLGAHMGEG